MGVDEMGVDEMGSSRSGNKPFKCCYFHFLGLFRRYQTLHNLPCK